MTMTPFAEWLSEQLQIRGIRRAQFAAYMHKPQSTINSWFNDDRVPRTDLCKEIARVLHVSEMEVLVRAGHISRQLAEEPAEYDALPEWVRFLPMLSRLDAQYVGRLVEDLARRPAQPDEPPAQAAPQ